ncbi:MULTISPECIES: glycine cleavage system protein R [unclassified Thioalkalivibrio]|uniref:glycine cleavage system protein R n=1 Tax=unclassified Thioalkalivibrio TaxID=2621013 RepID=UPI0003640C9C|nr:MULTISPECIES: ACT domain-containing protein [unclassified Thioalkalivibrio]
MAEVVGTGAHTHLILNLIGPDQPGLVSSVTRVIVDTGCNLESSRITVVGGYCCMALSASGNWKTLGTLESRLERLEAEMGLVVVARRGPLEERAEAAMPYAVDAVALDAPGLLNALADFFTSRGVNLRDVQTRVYIAQQTGARMFAANMVVDIPAGQHLASLRGEFMDFCDELNVDGVLDPIKA